MAKQGQLKICSKGHTFYKSSSCPVCPICEKERQPEADFLKRLSAPARRALEGIGIVTLEQLAMFTEKEILARHGMGPASLPILKQALESKGLHFKEQ